MTAAATRIFPIGTDERDLHRQWTQGPTPGRVRTVLLHMPPEDTGASDHVSRLQGPTGPRLGGIETEWTAAQLAADATLAGMGIGVRVVLVPERGRWYADLLVIPTRGWIRIGRGSVDATRALRSARRACLRSLFLESDVADVSNSGLPAPRLRPSEFEPAPGHSAASQEATDASA